VNNLLYTLLRLAQIQGEAVDRLALQDAVQPAGQTPSADAGSAREQLKAVTRQLQIKSAQWLKEPDESSVPALLYDTSKGWGILRGRNGQGVWIGEWFDVEGQKWSEAPVGTLSDYETARVRLAKPFDASKSPVFKLIKDEIFSHKKVLLEAALGGGIISLAALTTSLYSMQVYDRVVPTGAVQTLLVLTLGVMLATLFELAAKHVRSGLYERMIDLVDRRLSRAIYMRFLAIRLDQLPSSVGGLAAQLRGYESVRSFMTAMTAQLSVDAPFALLFLALIAAIAGWLALIPAAFFVISVAVGLYFKNRVNDLAGKATAASNFKAGLLVETIEGAETIKSGQGGWRMLSRWMKTSDEARSYELQMRHIQENSQHMMGAFQQVAYVLMVASGALLISKGEMTMGGLIACSILSGRVLTPAGMIPGQLIQWANTKAALLGLDRLWALQDDHHGAEHPLVPSIIDGNYRFEDVSFGYANNKALEVKQLVIRAGDKIGILGPIGGGKTSLLRLLSGMYKPQQGRILLDDMELSQISKPLLAEHIGYLQQEGRLFAGTLRDNLVLGMMDPGDGVILDAAKRTGLMAAVISAHPKGLQQDIYEGGSGLSGGQRQLVNLTRVFLRQPTIWLLDEPTASIDRNLELQVIAALKESLSAKDTLLMVTHKTEMLEVVDRLIVVVNHQIIMDGPKNEVLWRLQAGPGPQGQPNPQGQPVGAPAQPRSSPLVIQTAAQAATAS
jgi:ATP-binding cassette subfamily C protein LapB